MKPKVCVFVIMMLLVPSLVQSQFLWEPESGVLLRANEEQDIHLLLPGVWGESLIVWSDGRNGDYDLFGQLMNADGVPQWGDAGQALVEAEGNQTLVKGVTLDDGWLLAWLDTRGPEYTVTEGALYLQRYDSNGNPLWSTPPNPSLTGKLFYPDNRHVQAVSIVADGNEGAFVATALNPDYRHFCEVWLHRILLSDGSLDPNWPEEGVLLGAPPEAGASRSREIYLQSDLGGGVIALWHDWGGDYMNLLVHRIDATGQPVWDERLDLETDWSESFQICSDGEGGVFLAGKRLMYENYTWYGRVCFNRIRVDGSVAWGVNGVALSEYQQNGPSITALTPSYPGSAIMVVKESPDGGWLRARRLGDNDGFQYFWDSPVQFEQNSSGVYSASADPNGGIALFVRYDDGPRFHHISVNGNLFLNSPILPFDYWNAHPAATGTNVCYVSTMKSDVHSEIRYQLFDPVNQAMEFPVEGTFAARGLYGGTSIMESEIVRNGDIIQYVWTDERFQYQKRMPFVQQINVDTGMKLMGETGAPVFPHYADPDSAIGGTYLEMDAAADGSSFVGFVSNLLDDGGARVLLQKLSHAGQPLWGDAGIPVTNADASLNTTRLLINEDHNGGVFAVFHWRTPDYDEGLGIAHLDPEGNPLWQDGDNPYVSLQLDNEDYRPYGTHYVQAEERLLIVYTRETNLFCTALSSDGELEWTTSIAEDTAFQIIRVTTVRDQVLALWINPLDEVVGQLIDSNGTLLWGDDPLVLRPPQHTNWRDLSIAGPDSSSFWFAWSMHSDICYAQRFTLDGNPVFPDPVEIAGDVSIQVLGQADGSAYVATRSHEDNTGVSLDVQHLGALGEQDGNIARITHQGSVYITDMVPDGIGGAIVLWDQIPLFTQRFYLPAAGVDQRIVPLPASFTVSPVYPNPLNGYAYTTITLPAPSSIEITLLNMLGQRVWTYSNEMHTVGTHSIPIDAHLLASGMYFLSIHAPELHRQHTEKLVLLK